VRVCGTGGEPASDPAVLDALRARSGVLDRGGVTWIAGVVEEFREGTDVIREGRAVRLSPAEGRRRIEASDVLLVGFAHYLDGAYPRSGIRGELERRGRRVLLLVPFPPEWELAVRERGGAGAWLEVMPGVVRVPAVPDEEIRRFGS
jgi:hypothetical protein